MIKPTILIFGTDHFAEEDNGDIYMTGKEDILSGKRQSEILEVISCLTKFKPTKVALEVLQEREEALNEKYTSYSNGDLLTTNEVHQIGFRLARECNLRKVYAVDWNGSEEGIPDLTNWGEEKDSDEFKEFTNLAKEMIDESNTYLKNHSIKEYLLWHNDPQNVLRGQEMYMKLALVGDKSNPVGAMWTAKYWYYRNMLIYKNLVQLIDSKEEERIFVLYGAAHVHLLLQFIKEGGLFDVEVASDYLG